jgi:hypothetical protein
VASRYLDGGLQSSTLPSESARRSASQFTPAVGCRTRVRPARRTSTGLLWSWRQWDLLEPDEIEMFGSGSARMTGAAVRGSCRSFVPAAAGAVQCVLDERGSRVVVGRAAGGLHCRLPHVCPDLTSALRSGYVRVGFGCSV